MKNTHCCFASIAFYPDGEYTPPFRNLLGKMPCTQNTTNFFTWTIRVQCNIQREEHPSTTPNDQGNNVLCRTSPPFSHLWWTTEYDQSQRVTVYDSHISQILTSNKGKEKLLLATMEM